MLETIGYDAAMSRWAATADAEVGRVLRVDRGMAEVLTESGPLRAGLSGDLLTRSAGAPESAPCTGDWVVVQTWPDHRVTVLRVLPRDTAVVRATAGEQSHGQVLCANVDTVGVVVALHPEPALARVERLLVLAWESGAMPVVLLTKADLVTDAAFVAEDVCAVAPGTDVLCTSTESGEGVQQVRELVPPGKTLALLGASGHGKSSLANALAGSEVLSTREIRSDGRGRHTTVRRELVMVPGGGAVIDMPGLRGIGLHGASFGVSRAFADVEELVARCRFADCRHEREPACAVREALDTGTLPLRRYESWQALSAEVLESKRRRAERMGHRRGRPPRERA